MSGRFITLEGGEGAGKSTQSALLAAWLRERDLEVIETREPGGTTGADAIRTLLLDNNSSFTPLAEAHLFAAARADHVETIIRPALESGQWVICDRFVDSSLAYQGAAGKLGIDTVRAINVLAVKECWPDLTLLLETGVETGAGRAAARDGDESDRFSRRNVDFHTAVASGFSQLADAEPNRIATIDARPDIAAVADAIRAAVSERLL